MTSHWTHGVGLLTASDFGFFSLIMCAYWSDWSGQDFKIACHCKRHEPRLNLDSDTLAAIAPRSQGSGMVVMAPCQTILVLMHLMWHDRPDMLQHKGQRDSVVLLAWGMPAPCCLMCVESQVVVVLKRKSFTTFKWRQWRLSSKKMWRYAWDGMGPEALLSRMTKLKTSPGYQHSLL